MPKVTEAHVEARRSQILMAACKCFNKNGFHKTTVRDICREADLSAGAVYSYFKSKDEIVEALAAMGRQNTRAALGSAPPRERGPDSLARLLGRIIEILQTEGSHENSRMDVRLWGEGLHTPQLGKLFQEAFASLMVPFAEAADRGRQAGDIDEGLDPAAVARVCAALGLGFQVQRAMDPQADFAPCAEVISALVHGSFATGGREP